MDLVPRSEILVQIFWAVQFRHQFKLIHKSIYEMPHANECGKSTGKIADILAQAHLEQEVRSEHLKGPWGVSKSVIVIKQGRIFRNLRGWQRHLFSLRSLCWIPGTLPTVVLGLVHFSTGSRIYSFGGCQNPHVSSTKGSPMRFLHCRWRHQNGWSHENSLCHLGMCYAGVVEVENIWVFQFISDG